MVGTNYSNGYEVDPVKLKENNQVRQTRSRSALPLR